MVWSPRDDAWQRMFTKLTHYHAKHGHANVSTADAGDRRLAHCLIAQRRRHRQTKLSAECVKLLNELGIDWNPEHTAWDEMFRSLVEFKQQHRHFRVPRPWANNPGLPTWIVNQRRLNRRKALPADRVERLNQIGFPWSPAESAKRVRDSKIEREWEAFFRQLLQFKAKRGHCDVPRENRKDAALGQWLAKQCWLKNKGRLDTDRQRRLDEVGVQWGIKKVRLAGKPATNWIARYQQLLKFKRRHGHCNVSFSPLENAALVGWVSRQRQARKSRKLLPERERLLNEIGFVWTVAPRVNTQQGLPG